MGGARRSIDGAAHADCRVRAAAVQAAGPDRRILRRPPPDLAKATGQVRLLKDRLTASLLTLVLQPFGALIEEGPKGLELNEGVAMLKVELDDLQHQPFWLPQPIEVAGGLPPTPTWRPEAIDDTVKVFDAFDSYRGQAFSSLMVSDRREVFAVVRSEVAQLIATRLALTAAAGAPPTSAEQLTQLGVQLTKLGRLVPLLATQSPFGREIVNALDLQARSALQEIDRTASARYPSMFVPRRGRIFTVWADVQKGGAVADVLKRWGPVVDEQRDGARQLALQAQPIAAYLAARDPQEPALDRHRRRRRQLQSEAARHRVERARCRDPRRHSGDRAGERLQRGRRRGAEGPDLSPFATRSWKRASGAAGR